MLKRNKMIAAYIFLGAIALVLMIALFTNKDYSLSRNIKINKQDSTIYNYLKDFHNHQNFNAWLKKDPNIQVEYKGVPGEKGFTLTYDGNNEVGSGVQELTGLVENKQIDLELRFLKPFKNTSTTPFTIEAIDDSTSIVTWTMNGKMNYPMNIALWFISMDSLLGKDLQKSLNDLKNELEK